MIKVTYYLHVHTINISFINFIMSPDTKHYETLILSLNNYYWSKRQPYTANSDYVYAKWPHDFVDIVSLILDILLVDSGVVITFKQNTHLFSSLRCLF